jgi:hypothetical protein
MTNHDNCDIDVRLINPDWNIKVYKGNNKAGNRIYFIISSLEPKSLISTKLIDVEKLYDYSRNEWSLLFTLKSNSNSSLDMFKYIFKDILNSVNFNISERKSLVDLCTRYEHWQQLLSRLPDSFGRLKQQGLLAELLVLRDNLIPNYGVDKALEMWQGPKGAKQDFILPESWIEVKSTNLGKREIHISSLEQLDSPISYGELSVVTLQESNAYDSSAICLSTVIDEIESEINDDLIAIDFKEKLLLVGYGQNKENELYFRVCDIESYRVNEEFPKIKRNDISTAITKVSYTLNLEAISNFKIK